MMSVPLKTLKENLSEITEKAVAGERIEVTRYNKPYVYITGAVHPAVHRGVHVGKTTLASIGKAASKGKYLDYLNEDRQEK